MRGPKVPQKRAAPLHRNVWVATVTSFLTDVSSDMLQNLLPLFLANVLGVRVWAVGVVYGVADATSSVLKLYSGRLSDRLGARKWVAVAGYAISTLAKPFLYFANTWGAVAAVRFGDRVGKGVRTAPRDALLADSTPAEQRGFAFGMHRAGDSAGAVVGLLIAVWLVAGVQGSDALLAEGTFRKVVLWSLVPAALAVAVLAVGARDIKPDTVSREKAGVGFGDLGPDFRTFLWVSVVFEIGNSADAFLVLRAQERVLSVIGILWVLVGFNVVYTLVSAPAGLLADRLPRKWLVASGWLVYAAVYSGFALASDPSHIVMLWIVYGGYHGLVAGAAKALVADLVPSELRGTAYGTYAAAMGLVMLPASILAGLLWQGVGSWQGFGPAAPFIFGAAASLVATGLLWVFVPKGGVA
jgi:MFS family permease